jgi:LAO/AO transport system kinase
LGGLSAKTIELTDILRSAGFDYILVETVGVGQSEVEIAGLADITLVVLVPEAGDEIQGIKSGLMEIADAFIVNKADREGADTFANTLKKLSQQKAEPVPVLSTVASKAKGIEELIAFIDQFEKNTSTKKQQLLAQKAWQLLQQKLTAGLNKEQLLQDLAEAVQKSDFNLYQFIDNWTSRS